MPRSGPGEADRQLIAHAARHGPTVTARQLERWRAQGLLPPNVRKALGRGRGSASVPSPGAGQLVVWLAGNARRGRRPGDLALLAFAAGLGVPELTVRAAFADAVGRIRLSVERDVAPGTAPEDVADAAVAASPRFSMVSARIRRIDRALAQRGIDWAAPQLAALDPGVSSPRLVGRDWIHAGVQLVLTGGVGLDAGTIGQLARTLAPVGGAAPFAGQVEYRWPLGDDEVIDYPLNEDGELALAGGGLREQMTDLAATTPMSELLEAFRMAASLPEWARSMCDAVEREIAAAQPGEAVEQWATSAFGMTRLLMAVALVEGKDRPAGAATTALMLIFVRNMIRPLRQLVPPGNFDLLRNPVVAPPFLASFLGA